ncbi:hypothetical protein GBZ86_16775 [Clostridium tarantellae]|uniref:DUF2178 domain-containing protein n=2 Tax=Clostridium tarantellae TaxID=39493 RepID=A0A6I1MTA4_9CLOT|nr:hypothetical protein [Clostridium tarantellae]
MDGQIFILFFIIISTGITIFLYLWKAKKEVYYKKNERWQLIQNKANNIANYLNYIFIVFLAIAEVIVLFSNTQITLNLNRVLTYGLLFIGLRNGIELFALKYFDNKL